MQTPSNLKTFLTASFALCIIACNNTKKDKDATDKPADTAVATTTIPPPPADNIPTDTALQTAVQKCYRNDGLKYSTVITINYSAGADVTGSVVNKNLETDKKEAAKFTGTVAGDKLTIKFVGRPPVMGAASEWTDKPWTIGNKMSKEKITIVFNAKNYDTNKWAETEYEFEISGCK